MLEQRADYAVPLLQLARLIYREARGTHEEVSEQFLQRFRSTRYRKSTSRS